MYSDTIAAISTPIGEGGIGIVRLSGGKALPILQKIFRPSTHSPGFHPVDRRLYHGHIVHPGTGEIVDEVLVSYMAAPHTYTKEDTVEVNGHGGPLPLQRILEVVLQNGARLGNPGEFTMRAFLRGRIDLAQAEAVLDVIQSRTAASLRVAMDGLGGRLSAEVRAIRQGLLHVLAYLTATIDFPEDDIEAGEALQPVEEACRRVGALLESADTGLIYRYGVRTAIVGRPNVGKSSLLNRLLRENRAIVAPIPGTTRDTLEEVINLNGVPFILVDTAGITKSSDLVEQLGVERSRRAIERADLVLLVLDGSESLIPFDMEIVDSLDGKSVILAVNKCDLPRRVELDGLSWEKVCISALTGEGITFLERRLVEMVLKGGVVVSDALLVNNQRHKDALHRAAEHLSSAQYGLQISRTADLVVIDLTSAANALGEITGESVSEDLLETIFSRFCVGK
ncbi:MAG: tRNA uridine-5-carboxymethylaminomethyl(34) synthesis GTPase MnmE [Chloroflexi bacterium]|nr:tRNA uridine-5-carboxymethylaminomethyl(34) synthesis GTPase MnmE [Chloroflexota bacterium]